MTTIELTKDNVDSTIAGSDILLIDFWAEWCGPCKMFGPIFEEASEQHPGMVFAKCNTELQQEVATQFGIRSIPTLAIFREHILVYMQPGALPANALADIIKQVEELDMHDVRAKIAEQEHREAV